MLKFPGNDVLPEGVEIEFSIRHSDDESISHYVLEFEGRAHVWDDEEADDIRVGYINGYRIDLSTAQYDKLDLRELFDSVSAELSDFASTMMPDDQCILPATESRSSSRYCDTGGERQVRGYQVQSDRFQCRH